MSPHRKVEAGGADLEIAQHHFVEEARQHRVVKSDFPRPRVGDDAKARFEERIKRSAAQARGAQATG